MVNLRSPCQEAEQTICQIYWPQSFTCACQPDYGIHSGSYGVGLGSTEAFLSAALVGDVELVLSDSAKVPLCGPSCLAPACCRPALSGARLMGLISVHLVECSIPGAFA